MGACCCCIFNTNDTYSIWYQAAKHTYLKRCFKWVCSKPVCLVLCYATRKACHFWYHHRTFFLHKIHAYERKIQLGKVSLMKRRKLLIIVDIRSGSCVTHNLNSLNSCGHERVKVNNLNSVFWLNVKAVIVELGVDFPQVKIFSPESKFFREKETYLSF